MTGLEFGLFFFGGYLVGVIVSGLIWPSRCPKCRSRSHRIGAVCNAMVCEACGWSWTEP